MIIDDDLQREREKSQSMATVYDNSQWNRSALVLFTLLLFPHPEAGFVPSLIIDGVPMWKHSFITKDCFFSSSPSVICKQQDRKILHCQECEIGIAIKWICLAKKETTLKNIYIILYVLQQLNSILVWLVLCTGTSCASK